MESGLGGKESDTGGTDNRIVLPMETLMQSIWRP
jgi:hypothetical protein